MTTQRIIRISPDDFEALVRIMNAEAGHQSPLGRLAVASTIFNRLASGRFRDSIIGIIEQPYQFEPVSRARGSYLNLPKPPPERYDEARSLLSSLARGEIKDPTNGATFFLQPEVATRRGTNFGRTDPIAEIDDHVFYDRYGLNPPIAVPSYKLELDGQPPLPAPRPTATASPAPPGFSSQLFNYLADNRSDSHIAGMTPELRTRLERMLADAPDSIRSAISITSGYRSPERQAQLFADAVNKYGSEDAARKWVAPPGKSQHNHGSAADLSFDTEEARQWFHDNAERYGLKFPLRHEPWHIEVQETRGGNIWSDPPVPPAEIPNAPSRDIASATDATLPATPDTTPRFLNPVSPNEVPSVPPPPPTPPLQPDANYPQPGAPPLGAPPIVSAPAFMPPTLVPQMEFGVFNLPFASGGAMDFGGNLTPIGWASLPTGGFNLGWTFSDFNMSF